MIDKRQTNDANDLTAERLASLLAELRTFHYDQFVAVPRLTYERLMALANRYELEE